MPDANSAAVHNAVPSVRRMLTIPQSAEYLNVSVNTVRRMIVRGDLRAIRLGPQVIRVRLADLESAGEPVESIGAYL